MAQQLYWAYVGFTDIADGKTRPVLYIRQTDTDYVVFRLSSQYENKSAFIKSKYVEIKNWQQAGLKYITLSIRTGSIVLPINIL